MIDVGVVWPIWCLLAGFVLVAWLSLRARMKNAIRATPPVLDDDDVRKILEDGHVVTDEDEPLDLDEIRQAEDSFWEEERWDPSEEY